jgi:chorismate mutase
LTRLRHEIESIDRSIVLLLAARLDAVQRALRVRAGANREITDREQERRILLRSRKWAHELGLPRTLVDELFRSLIEEGKARFRSDENRPESPVVTVLVAAPDGLGMELGSDPHSQLVPVPTSR